MGFGMFLLAAWSVYLAWNCHLTLVLDHLFNQILWKVALKSLYQ